MSYVPFMYEYIMDSSTTSMKFISGIATISQHPDGSVEPMVSWGVVCSDEPSEDSEPDPSIEGWFRIS